MRAFDNIVTILLIVGGLNWGLCGVLQLDLVNHLLGDTFARIVYVIVGLSAISKVVLWSMESPTE